VDESTAAKLPLLLAQRVAQDIIMADCCEQAQEGPDSSTPSHAATPTASHAPQLATRGSDTQAAASAAAKAPNKKKRPTDKDNEDGEKSAKRGKISYARD